MGEEDDIRYLRRDVDKLEEALKEVESKCITRMEFMPVQRVVYGLVTLLMTSVGLAIFAAVFKT